MKNTLYKPEFDYWSGCGYKMKERQQIYDEIIGLEGRLNRFAYYLTGDSEEAKDLTQDTLLKALEKSSLFRGESTVRTWLDRIMVNTFLSRQRKVKNHVSLSLEQLPVPDWSANPEKIVVKRELQWCIRHTLAFHLPERYAAALTLRELEGLSYREIAEAMDLAVGTAKVLVHRSRRAFKRHLEQSGCYSYVKDYRCICDGVLEGLLPQKGFSHGDNTESKAN